MGPLVFAAALGVLLRTGEAALLLRGQSGQVPEAVPPLEGIANDTDVAPVDPLSGCFETVRAVCLQGDRGQSFAMSPVAKLSDLVLSSGFDKSLPVDDSGYGNHLRDSKDILSPIPTGPGVLGRGGSANFDGTAYRKVRSTKAFESNGFSVALWLYLLEDSVGAWRTIFHKGETAGQMLPALLFLPDERRLHARVSRSSELGEGILESSGLLPLRRWTHITMTYTGNVLRLYVNGLKDGEAIIEESSWSGEGDLHIGRDPWRRGTKCYLDDLRWYNRPLAPSEVRALTSPSITGIGTDFVHLGCSTCTFTEAVRRCQGHAHLCSLQELFAGGFHTARVMGWLTSSMPEVWYYNQKDGDGDVFAGDRKLGLCCTNH